MPIGHTQNAISLERLRDGCAGAAWCQWHLRAPSWHAPVAAPVAAPIAAPVAAPIAAPIAAPVAAPAAAPVRRRTRCLLRPSREDVSTLNCVLHAGV